MNYKNLAAKLTAVLLFTAIFGSCQKDLYEDEFQPDRQGLKSAVYSLGDIRYHTPEVYTTYAKAIRKKINRGVDAKDVYGFDVDTTKILYLEKMDGYKSYTFHIKELSQAQEYLDNLVISVSPEGRTDVYHVRYDLNKAIYDIEQTAIKQEIAQMSMSRISLATYGYRDELCVTVGIWVSVPSCEGDLVTPEESPRCFNPDGTRAYHDVFVGVTYCSGPSGGPDVVGPPIDSGPPPVNPGPWNPGVIEGGGGTNGGTSGINNGSVLSDNPPGDPDENQPISTSPWIEGDDGPDPPTPCDELNELAKADVANIKPSIDALRAHVSGQNTFEKGVSFQKANHEETGDPVFSNVDLEGSNYRITIPLGTVHYGGAHTHPYNGHPMFSFADVVILKDLYENARPSNVKYVTYMLTVRASLVPYEVKTYAIKVTDIASLKAYIDSVFAQPQYEGMNEQQIVDEEVKRQGIVYDKCDGEYVKTFLQKFSSYGISLHTSGLWLDNWKQISLVNNEVVEHPCNQS